MAQFSVNAQRQDPYQGFKFRVRFEGGDHVAGLMKMGALKRTTAPVLHRDGGDPSHERKNPGKSTFDAVMLERGVTHDSAFETWANTVHSWKDPISLKGFRRNVTVDLYNEANQKVLSYHLYRCWVSEYTALPQLDSGSAAIAIESIKVELEGWERDTAVTEPTEV